METYMEDYNHFRARFNIPALVPNDEEEMDKFKKRIDTYIRNAVGYISNYDYQVEFADFDYISRDPLEYVLYGLDDFYEVLYKLQYIINLKFRSMRKTYIEKIKEIINKSNINVSCIIVPDGNSWKIELHPRGDSVLDKALVDDLCENLGDTRPRDLFLQAVKAYQNGDFHHSADILRKTLELVFKNYFAINKSLENIIIGEEKSEFLKKLAEIVPHPEHKNYILKFCELVDCYMKFNNNGIKHLSMNEKILDEASLEFILYQTGSFIRFLDKLKEIKP